MSTGVSLLRTAQSLLTGWTIHVAKLDESYYEPLPYQTAGQKLILPHFFNFFFKQELLHLNANIYIENRLKIKFSSITGLLGSRFQ